MNKQSRISAIPVNQEFEHQGKRYTRTSYWRGKYYENGKPMFKKFYKHDVVTWINAYTNGL